MMRRMAGKTKGQPTQDLETCMGLCMAESNGRDGIGCNMEQEAGTNMAASPKDVATQIIQHYITIYNSCSEWFG